MLGNADGVGNCECSEGFYDDRETMIARVRWELRSLGFGVGRAEQPCQPVLLKFIQTG
jgi:hypothetical protein